MRILSKKNLRNQGASTLEYLILVTGVIVTIIFFLGPGGPFRTKISTTQEQTSEGITNVSARAPSIWAKP